MRLPESTVARDPKKRRSSRDCNFYRAPVLSKNDNRLKEAVPVL
jgi:hypothetical protein